MALGCVAPEPVGQAVLVKGIRDAGEQHGQPLWLLDQLPALGRHLVHDAVNHRRLHRDLAPGPGWEGQGFLDAPLDALDESKGRPQGQRRRVDGVMLSLSS
jgi:hypothetical protein